MSKYNIYAGLGGGFGGPVFIDQIHCDSYEEAEAIAYDYAVQQYESHAGMQGLLSWQECRAEAEDSFTEEELEIETIQLEIDSMTDVLYGEEINRWISYHVIKISE